MTRALAQEKLGYAPAELEALSRQVQMGDLTAVMQIYEEDIKSPVRSAVQGTLLRSLFIQVQKAKVSVSPLPSPVACRPGGGRENGGRVLNADRRVGRWTSTRRCRG